MLSLLSQMNPDMVKPVRDALRAAKTPSEPPPQEELQADYTTPEERDATSAACAKCLVTWCLRYGVPANIWSGQDSQLVSNVLQRVCARSE